MDVVCEWEWNKRMRGRERRRNLRKLNKNQKRKMCPFSGCITKQRDSKLIFGT
jgi:hypothetical protein